MVTDVLPIRVHSALRGTLATAAALTRDAFEGGALRARGAERSDLELAFVYALLERLEMESAFGDFEPLERWMAELGAFEAIADYRELVDFAFAALIPHTEPDALDVREAILVRRDELMLALAERSPVRTAEANRVDAALAEALYRTLDSCDGTMGEHCRRTALIAEDIARELGLDDKQVETARIVGLIHDVGSVKVPAHLERKAAGLTEQERTAIEAHVMMGVKIIKAIPELAGYAPFVEAHHERYDGTGYPNMLAGDRIPLISSIVALADAIQALLSPRPFREPMSTTELHMILQEGRSTQWDPHLIDAAHALLARRGGAIAAYASPAEPATEAL